MANHDQRLLETPFGNFPQITRQINGAYTTVFHIKRHRSGHLFKAAIRPSTQRHTFEGHRRALRLDESGISRSAPTRSAKAQAAALKPVMANIDQDIRSSVWIAMNPKK